jgi:hypothetical protein
MTHALMIPAMRVTMIMMIVVADAVGTKTARGITNVGTAIMIGPHATTREGMVGNHATMIAAMRRDDSELGFKSSSG